MADLKIFFYSRNFADYSLKASHLSLVEHGALTLLSDRYFASGSPIPAHLSLQICKARSKSEKQAVESVLNQFFFLENGAWHSLEIEQELEKIKLKSQISKTNGKKGGRPPAKKEDDAQEENNEENQGEGEPGGLILGSQKETQTKAIQEIQPKTYDLKTKKQQQEVVVDFSFLPKDLVEIVQEKIKHLPHEKQADVVDELSGRILDNVNPVRAPESFLKCLISAAQKGQLTLDSARNIRKMRAQNEKIGTLDLRKQRVKEKALGERTPQTITQGLEILEKYGASTLAQKAKSSIH